MGRVCFATLLSLMVWSCITSLVLLVVAHPHFGRDLARSQGCAFRGSKVSVSPDKGIREGGGFCQKQVWQDQLFVPLVSLISSEQNKKWLQLVAELLLKKKNQIMAFCHGNNSFRNQQWEFYVPLFLQITFECDKRQRPTEQ